MWAAKHIPGNLKPYWMGCLMRDQLPSEIKSNFGVLNLDSSDSRGTHWTAWYAPCHVVYYFDSFGLPPPQEFVDRVEIGTDIDHSTLPIQTLLDLPYCGYVCVIFLDRMMNGENFEKIILDLYEHVDERLQ